MKSEFEIAMTQLSADRNLSPEVILQAIEAALVSAYKRNYGSVENVGVTIDPHSGQARVSVKKLVSETVEDTRVQIPLAEARTYDPDAEIGGLVDIEVRPRNFGRIAAQTAKQVIAQRIREAERDSVYLEYAERVGEIVNCVVRNVDSRSRNVILSLGKAEAMLPRAEQIPREYYRFGQRLRVYIVAVERTGHGPQITVSRAHRDLLRRLLELEVPEIYNGTVEVKAIAREPGFRSKVAVAALQAGVDPVGSCVGMRGVRVRNIVNELNGEKIDVVAWSSDIGVCIANALSPARVVSVYLNEEEKTAKVIVPDRSLSLAIGKEGQNARLAAKLTGWRIDIKSETEAAEEAERLAAEMEEAAERARELEEARLAAAELLAEAQAGMEEEQAAEEEALVTEELPSEVELPSVDEREAEAIVEEAEILAVEEPATAEEAPATTEESEAAVSLPEGEALVEAEGEETAVEVEEAEVELEEEHLKPEEEEEVELEPEAEDLEIEEEDDYDEEDEGSRSRGQQKRRRSRLLEYDERLGEVVSRKTRKPSRTSWEDSWEDEEQ